MSKYKNRKTVYRGIRFDSLKEAKRYAELLTLERLGKISGLERQKRYELIPSQKLPTPVRRCGQMKKTEKAIFYVADFVYQKDGQMIVEDTKGYQTPEYIIKRKLMLHRYGIQVMEL